MPEWIIIALLAVGYLLLIKWVLPRLGVPT